jgi:hypothetical protein
MSRNEEEELVRLNEIFKTLKEDALEVTDLIVKGIDSYKLMAYIAIAAGIFSLWNLPNFIVSNDLLQITVWIFFAIIFFLVIPYLLYKNRQLKKKYQELINIHESLTED